MLDKHLSYNELHYHQSEMIYVRLSNSNHAYAPFQRFDVSCKRRNTEIKENLQQGKLRNAAQIFKIEILKDYT